MLAESRLFTSLELVENMSETDFNGRILYIFFCVAREKNRHLEYSTFVSVIDFKKCTHIELGL